MTADRNVGIIFAGGVGRRMHAGARPKQFLELYGKPIIIYTLELFERHAQVDAIYVACVADWIDYMKDLVGKYGLRKVKAVVPGGQTGQDSIYCALRAAYDEEPCPARTVALIHDGVRPLIYPETITDNIRQTREQGSCITCVPATETFVVTHEDGSLHIPSRKNSLIARAPQSFFLEQIYQLHLQARGQDRHDFIDSLTLVNHYGMKVSTVLGPSENIKITTPTDYFIFKAIVEARENTQIFGD